MAWTESGCSNPLTAGTKNDAGILCRSSSAKIRGNPVREPYSPCANSAGLSEPSRSGPVSLSRSNDNPTATRAPLGHDFGVRSRPARTRPTRARLARRSTSTAQSPVPARTRRCRREERTESHASWKTSGSVSLNEEIASFERKTHPVKRAPVAPGPQTRLESRPSADVRMLRSWLVAPLAPVIGVDDPSQKV